MISDDEPKHIDDPADVAGVTEESDSGRGASTDAAVSAVHGVADHSTSKRRCYDSWVEMIRHASSSMLKKLGEQTQPFRIHSGCAGTGAVSLALTVTA